MSRTRTMIFSALLFPCLLCYAQTDRTASVTAARDSKTPFLIPQAVFVGDRARLVVPLGSTFSGEEGIVLNNQAELPQREDVAIRRLELEKQGGSFRLLVDFDAYAPGRLELPRLTLGRHEFSGLEVHISSILASEGNSGVLSPAAQALSVPGTVLIIYGMILALIVCIVIFLIIFLVVIPRLPALSLSRERRRFIKAFKKNIRRLEEELKKEISPAAVLASLSLSFRELLSCFTGRDCRALVPGEFFSLRNEDASFPARAPESGKVNGGSPGDAERDFISGKSSFLASFFGRSDVLRFSGRMEKNEVFAMLEEAKSFTAELETQKETEVKKNKNKPELITKETGGVFRGGVS